MPDVTNTAQFCCDTVSVGAACGTAVSTTRPNFTENDRQELFDNFLQVGNFDRQNQFLLSCVQIVVPKRPKADAVKPKSASRVCYLNGKRVCREFLLRTLDISQIPFTCSCIPTLEKQSPEALNSTRISGYRNYLYCFIIMCLSSTYPGANTNMQQWAKCTFWPWWVRVTVG